MPREEKQERRPTMSTQPREVTSPFSGIGEPQKADVAITVLTALILLAVLVVIAVWS
jgi:hypothetical protein